MHFGATLRLLRIDAGLSLRALAQQVGVSSAYLSRVENGHDAVPTPDRLTDIAHALGLAPMLLLELAHQVGPYVSRYLEAEPAANALFLEIARRRLTGPQLARVKAFVDAEFPKAAVVRAGRAPAAPPLSELLAPERVVLDLACADLEDVIDVAASRLAPAGGASDARALATQIMAREREAPTSLGNGVAVPHAVIAKSRPVAALLTLARPLAEPAPPDGEAIRLYVVLVSAEPGRAHLEALAQVARLASHNFAQRLCEARTAAQLLRRLAQIELECG